MCFLLSRDGFEILRRNWRTPFGEVDLVAVRGALLLIVEVKVRRKNSTDGALKAVSIRQRARLQRAAQWIWLRERHRFGIFQTRLAFVTGGEVIWSNLPLLYDQA